MRPNHYLFFCSILGKWALNSTIYLIFLQSPYMCIKCPQVNEEAPEPLIINREFKYNDFDSIVVIGGGVTGRGQF